MKQRALTLFLCLAVFLLTGTALAESPASVGGYRIWTVEVQTGRVTAEVTAAKDCILAAALYDENGKMLTFNTAAVTAGINQPVTVALAGASESTPVKVFLVSGDGYAPLCGKKVQPQTVYRGDSARLAEVSYDAGLGGWTYRLGQNCGAPQAGVTGGTDETGAVRYHSVFQSNQDYSALLGRRVSPVFTETEQGRTDTLLDLEPVAVPTADDLVFIVEAATITGGVNDGLAEATVLLTDGSEQSMVIGTIFSNGDNGGFETSTKGVAPVLINGAAAEDYAQGINGVVYVGALYTYSTDGVQAALYPVTNQDRDITVGGETRTCLANDLGYATDYGFVPRDFSGQSKAYTSDAGLIDGRLVDDGALIFAAENMTGPTGASAKVFTGEEVKSWDSDWGIETQYLCSEENSVPFIQAAAIYDTTDGYAFGSVSYGIVNSEPETITLEGREYTSFDLWTGDDASQYVIDGSSIPEGQGAVVSYSVAGTVEGIPEIDGGSFIQQTMTAAMLAATPGGGGWELSMTNSTGEARTQVIYTVDEDTTVLFLDDDEGTWGDPSSLDGYTAGESAIAGVYVPNVIFRTTSYGSTTLDLLVVGIRGNVGDTLTVGSELGEGVTGIDLDSKMIEISGSTVKAKAVRSSFDNLLATDPAAGTLSSGSTITVVATNGEAYAFGINVPGSVISGGP